MLEMELNLNILQLFFSEYSKYLCIQAGQKGKRLKVVFTSGHNNITITLLCNILLMLMTVKMIF